METVINARFWIRTDTRVTIRFPADKPLPAALVKKIVEARMKENEERVNAKKNKKTHTITNKIKPYGKD